MACRELGHPIKMISGLMMKVIKVQGEAQLSHLPLTSTCGICISVIMLLVIFLQATPSRDENRQLLLVP